MADNDNHFKTGDYVVYPAHGVGQVKGVETQVIGGADVSLYTISFEKGLFSFQDSQKPCVLL